jgi:flagellar hook-length control protein FliK
VKHEIATSNMPQSAELDSLPRHSEPALPALGNLPASSKDTHAEIRLAVQSDVLGPVEIRAEIKDNQVNASLAVQRHEARELLSNDLPSLQHSLADRDLRLDQIRIVDLPYANSDHYNQPGSQRDGGQGLRQHLAQARQDADHESQTERTIAEAGVIPEQAGQINIHV